MSNATTPLVSQLEAQKSQLDEISTVIRKHHAARTAAIAEADRQYAEATGRLFDEITNIANEFSVIEAGLRIVGRSTGMSEKQIDAIVAEVNFDTALSGLQTIRHKAKVNQASAKETADLIVSLMDANHYYFASEIGDLIDRRAKDSPVTAERARVLLLQEPFRDALKQRGISMSQRGHMWQFCRKSQTKGTAMTNTLQHLIRTANKPLSAAEVLNIAIKQKVATKDQRYSVNGALGSMVQSGMLVKDVVDGKNVYSALG